MENIYFKDIEKGTPLPVMDLEPISRTDIVKYVAATSDFNPVYFDDDFAHQAGKRGVIVPGTLIMGQLSRMISQWSPQSVVKSFTLNQTKLVRPGDKLLCKGLVVDCQQHNQLCEVDCELWADNEQGETVVKGRISLIMPQSKERPVPKKAMENGFPLITSCDMRKNKSAAKPKTATSKAVAKTSKTAAKKAPAKKAAAKKKK